MLTQQDYKTAIEVQNASVLSGVVYEFARIMERICDEHDNTPDRNRHPICRLFAEKILQLSGGGIGNTESFMDAYQECEEKSK